jgi:hypothetical protein
MWYKIASPTCVSSSPFFFLIAFHAVVERRQLFLVPQFHSEKFHAAQTVSDEIRADKKHFKKNYVFLVFFLKTKKNKKIGFLVFLFFEKPKLPNPGFLYFNTLFLHYYKIGFFIKFNFFA